jgi:hypothetical protein
MTTKTRKMIAHCYVGPDARLGVWCKRRGVNLVGYRKAVFLAMPIDGKEAPCHQCRQARGFVAVIEPVEG